MPRPRYVLGLYNAWAYPGTVGPALRNHTAGFFYFFDGWRVQPTLDIASFLPEADEAPVCDVGSAARQPPSAEPTRSPEEEAASGQEPSRGWTQHSQSSHPRVQVPKSHGQPTCPPLESVDAQQTPADTILRKGTSLS